MRRKKPSLHLRRLPPLPSPSSSHRLCSLAQYTAPVRPAPEQTYQPEDNSEEELYDEDDELYSEDEEELTESVSEQTASAGEPEDTDDYDDDLDDLDEEDETDDDDDSDELADTGDDDDDLDDDDDEFTPKFDIMALLDEQLDSYSEMSLAERMDEIDVNTMEISLDELAAHIKDSRKKRGA